MMFLKVVNHNINIYLIKYIKGTGDQLFLGVVGEDVLSKTYTARISRKTPKNMYLLIKMLRVHI